MRIFKTRWFARWALKECISDLVLIDAVAELDQGLIDAHLGANVVKKRVGIAGRGKSAGLRTILAFKFKDRAFFLYGFAKNQQDNIDDKELKALKLLARHLLAYDAYALELAKTAQELLEIDTGVNHGKKR
jgi:hypothetical protein